MSRLAIQALFCALSLAWGTYVAIDLFAHTYGDCADAACEKYKSAARGMIFWRGTCVFLLLVFGYRFFRKERDVY